MDAVEVAQHDFGVVGPAEGNVQLCYFVAGDGTRVGYRGRDGEHDVPEMRVAAWSSAGRDGGLCAAVLSVRWKVRRRVHAVGRVTG